MNLRVRRSVIVLIVAGWIAAAVWIPSVASAAPAPGDPLTSWTVSGVTLPFGVGYTGKVWISSVDPFKGIQDADKNLEFNSDGGSTGRVWPASWVGSYAADMAYVPGLTLMCQVNVGGDHGIYCWNPGNNTVADKIVGTFPWTSRSQRGLAYRASDDTFYIGSWFLDSNFNLTGFIYHIKGLSWPDKGMVISQCTPTDPSIVGLAYNAVFNVLWVATNSATDTIYALDPDTCAIKLDEFGKARTLPHPDPGFNGAGLEMDENGNLWMVSQGSAKAFLVYSGLSASAPPPTIPTLRDVVDAMPPDGAFPFRNLGLKQAFEARMNDIMRLWPKDPADNPVPALQMLRNLRMRTDGCLRQIHQPDQDDWIINCDWQLKAIPAIDAQIKKLGG